MMKKLMAAILLASLLLTALCVQATAELASEWLGKPLPDFTVDTIDGGTFTLSEALKERDMVLINLWASWCPPCEMEFPAMQEAYAQYSDRVAVIALSVEPNDTDEVLREYVEAHGMTFPVGSDAQTNLATAFMVTGIPTSIVVDRFGNVAAVEVGAQLDVEVFTGLFDYFLDDGYARTAVLDGFQIP